MYHSCLAKPIDKAFRAASRLETLLDAAFGYTEQMIERIPAQGILRPATA